MTFERLRGDLKCPTGWALSRAALRGIWRSAVAERPAVRWLARRSMAPDSIQVIIPARDDEATIGAVVLALRAQGLGTDPSRGQRQHGWDGGGGRVGGSGGFEGAGAGLRPGASAGLPRARGGGALGAVRRRRRSSMTPRRWRAWSRQGRLAGFGAGEVDGSRNGPTAWQRRLASALGTCGRRFSDVGPWRLVRREVLEK